MLRLSSTTLFNHLFIFFASLPWCRAFLIVDDPTPAHGSGLFSGQGFTLRWSGNARRSSTMNIKLWDWEDNKLWKKWNSIPISSMSFSDTFPNMPSGKYYFECIDSESGDYEESDDFFVSLAPVIVTSPVTTTATTTTKPAAPMPPTTTAGFTQPTPPHPPVPTPISSKPQRPSSIANASGVGAPHSTTIPTNSSNSAPSMNGGPTNGTSNPTSTSSSSATLGGSPVNAIAHSKHLPIGAIVGGALGGAAILFAILIFVIIRRRRHRSSLKEPRAGTPTDSEDRITHVSEHGDERTLSTAVETALEEPHTIMSNLGRNVAESSRNDNNGDEETQRLMGQIAIMNARIQQLEVHEQQRQSTVVDLLSPPPIYNSGQTPVNDGVAAFVMHKSARG